MKKMIVLTGLWSFLFIFSFSMFGCSEDDDEFGTTAERGNEVRTPRVAVSYTHLDVYKRQMYLYVSIRWALNQRPLIIAGIIRVFRVRGLMVWYRILN